MLLIWILAGSGLVAAEPEPGPDHNDPSSQEILDKYISATRAQQAGLRGVQMEIDIDAKLPKLQKQGRFHALRNISRLGRVTYDAIRFAGDNTIKKDVIARYLSAENQVQDPTAFAISPANYKFKYKGLNERDGRQVHIFQLSPRRKAVGLFKGDLWLDAATCLPLRESGRFVKNPSVFLKKIEFVREYEIREGLALPRHIHSIIDTRLVGRAELSIDFSNFTRPEIADAGATATR